MEKDENLMELLRRLDDLEWMEFPAGYSRDEAAASFSSLAAEIDSRFSTRCEIDRDIRSVRAN